MVIGKLLRNVKDVEKIVEKLLRNDRVARTARIQGPDPNNVRDEMTNVKDVTVSFWKIVENLWSNQSCIYT